MSEPCKQRWTVDAERSFGDGWVVRDGDGRVRAVGNTEEEARGAAFACARIDGLRLIIHPAGMEATERYYRGKGGDES